MKKPSQLGVWSYETGVAGLVQHRRYGYYYSRFQLNGKRTMKALDTDVFSVAKERHFRVLADNEKARHAGVSLARGTCKMGEIIAEARAAYEADTSLKAKSKACFASSIGRLLKFWPACFGVSMEAVNPAQINGAAVERFANYLHKQAQWRQHNTQKVRCGYGAVTVNATLEALSRIMAFAKAQKHLAEVPFDLKSTLGQKDIRKPEPKKKINFPSQDRIRAVFAQMRTVAGAPDSVPELLAYLQSRADESADFAEFMAYSGARQKEAAAWTWEDEREHSIFIRGTKTEESRDREVPKIAAMSELLKRMKERRAAQGRALVGRAFSISECRAALTTACKRAAVERWTHHSLRHLFATRCIESGVDIPTVSRWLGHADGGALAMKTYSHLRTEHSQAQAAKVNFGVVCAA
ncbi:MAG TPA: site-specific integrase [Lacunisphaera sp.]|jgi:integrase|nr:site-specific integrase [Lacunisphaera sp.]